MHTSKNLASVIFFILFCFISELYSQYSFKRPKGTYGVVFGFDLGMRLISGNEGVDVRNLTGFDGVRNESANLSFRLGFDYSRFLGNSIYLKSGVRVLNPSYRTIQLFSIDEEFRAELKAADLTRKRLYTQKYYFLEVPLHIRYVYTFRNCRSFVETGITTQYYLGTILSTNRAGNEEVHKLREDIFPLYFSGVLAIGAEYELKNGIPVFIQLITRYQINSIQKGMASERLISLGIEAGTRYYF